MNLKVERIHKKEDYTIGKLYIDGVYLCDTLEDAVRTEKIYGKTAIPAGNYMVEVNFSNKFQKLMPQILDVPGFTYVRIHSGNRPEDTEGCILVGFNRIKGQLVDSRKAFDLLMHKISQYEDLIIDIC